MAALDFPGSPTNGQIYNANGLSYSWDSDKNAWVNRGVPGLPGSSSTDNILRYNGTQWANATGASIDSNGDFSGTAITLTGNLAVQGTTQITGTILEDVYSWATTSGANTTDLDPDNGSIHTVTLTGNITSLTDNLSSGEAITLMIDDGTAYSITWPTMTWVNNSGSAPTLATSGYTVVALWKVSTTLYGALVGDGS